MIRRARAPLAAIGMGVVLAGCHVPGFDVPQAASTQGRQAERLWHGTEFAALAVGAIVWGLIAWCVIYYRRRKRAPDDVVPSQQAANIPLEVVYTLTPLAIIAVLFAFTTATQRRLNAVSSHPDLTVDATAFQWGWQFHYEAGARPGQPGPTVTSGATPPVLELPENETVRFNLTATDVVHAFYVPAFLFQRNAVPGSPTTFDITPDRLGDFGGKCATFCGIRHWAMLFTVRVVTPEQFHQWLEAR